MEGHAVPAVETARQASRRATLGLGLAVLIVGVLFAVNGSDGAHWYALFKWVHVSFAVFWVGGGVLLTILGLRAEFSDDQSEIVTLARWAGFVGERMFAPAGLVVLAMGIAMLIHGGGSLVHWSKFWVIVGLLGYALTFITGIAVLAPQAKRVDQLASAHGPHAPETVAAIRKILMISRFDMAVLLIVIADMVTKPFS